MSKRYAALGALWVLGLPAAALADPEGAALRVSCTAFNASGRTSVVARVENVSAQPLQSVAAGPIIITSIGTASMLVQVEPRAVRELLPGKRTELQWTGRVYGNGYLNFAVQVKARAADGDLVDSGRIGCPRLAVGNPAMVGGMTPGSTRPCTDCHNGPPNPVTGNWNPVPARTTGAARTTPTRPPATRTFTPTATPRRPPTATPARPTRTRIPTPTRRPTRTPQGTASRQSLPDLTVDESSLRTSVVIETRHFGRDDCAVTEGCVHDTGRRRLLRFTTTTLNLGPGDFVIGNPASSPYYEYDQCHEHYDWEGFWDFHLLNFDGGTVAAGEKHAWCLVDVFRANPTARSNPRFADCGNHGISAGWADVYARTMDCQWVDITGVPSGRYVLDVEVNPERQVREADYDNNAVRTEVYIPPEGRR